MNVLFEGKTELGKDEWLTPPNIIKALGEFDLDPCSPIKRPWSTAKHHYTIEDNGLTKEWFGRVWLNPPYGNTMNLWLNKMANHGNGIALTFNRSETDQFFRYVWNKADAILFIKGRLRFYHVSGEKGGNAGCGSVLIAYGSNNVEALKKCGLGKLLIIRDLEDQESDTSKAS
jgi:hypothetical protein